MHEKKTGENDMLGFVNARRAVGTIGIAMVDEMLVRTIARILSGHGLEVTIFNRTDVMSGAWPVLPYTAVVVSPQAMERRGASERRDDAGDLRGDEGARHPTILALPRGALSSHRDKVATADGFILTDEALEHLPRLVTLAAHGLSVMPRGVRSDRVQVSPRLERMKQLSTRDIEVLEELSFGRDNRSIASSLGMSVPATKTHIRRIIERGGFRNRTDAAVFAAVYLAPRRPPATTLEAVPARKG